MASFVPHEDGAEDHSLVVNRDDGLFIEWLASEVCAATATSVTPWKRCEVWRADSCDGGGGGGARVDRGGGGQSSSSGDLEKLGLGLWSPGSTPDVAARPLPVAEPTGMTKLTLACGATPRRSDCYSPMRSPRGHVCPRCLEDGNATFLRCASATSFPPGIGLVGRAWLTGSAEVVDLLSPTTEPSTFARLEAASLAKVSTAVALPVTFSTGAPSAVFVVYFAERFTATVDARTTPAQAALAAMVARGRDASRRFGAAAKTFDLPAAAAAADFDFDDDDDANADANAAARAAAPPFARGRRRKDSDSSASSANSPHGRRPESRDPRSDPTDAADRHFARKLPAKRAAHRDGVHQCPVCYGTIERAATVVACAHSACAECLARWCLTSDRCPSCTGVVDSVVPNARLDRQIAGAKRPPLRRSALSF